MREDFNGKTIAVVGLARSGVACADVLTRRGARVRVYDGKPEASLEPEHFAAVRALGIEPRLGGTAVDYAELDYVVTSPGVRRDAPVLLGAIAAGVPILGEIEAAYRVARAPILAITGTNGKTTTTVLLGEMLRAAGIETYVAGNIAAGEIAMPLIQAADIAGPDAAIVAEISSFQLEWITTFRPKVAALLNITPDHADRQNWAEYQAAKWRLFAYQTAQDAAVVPGVYVYHAPHSAEIAALKAVLWQFEQDGWQKRGVFERDGQIFLYEGAPKEAFRATPICTVEEVKLPGAHNLENICAAAAMAAAFGADVNAIRQAAITFTGVVHRLEFIASIDGVRWVNNSMCTNTAAFEKSLEALPQPKVVIAGGVFKGSSGELAAVAKAVAHSNVRALLLIGDSAPAIAEAVHAAGYQNVSIAGALPAAVREARALAHNGDTVLLAPACASFDQFKNFEDRGDQFKALVHAELGK